MSTIEKIYDIIPKYHAIWKNDYSGWSFGEVGCSYIENETFWNVRRT